MRRPFSRRSRWIGCVLAVLGLMVLGFGTAAGVVAQDDMPDVVDTTAVLQRWEIVVGFFTPIVLDFLLQSTWSRRVQTVLSFIWCWVIAALGLWLEDKTILDGDLVDTALTIFVVAIPSYYGFWKNVAPDLKAKTDL